MVIDELGAWSKVRPSGRFERTDAPVRVYNLVVADDHSYVVNDLVVHNAQEFLIQFALENNAALLVRAHTTGRNKVHPEHGVAALFVEIENGAWLIPNDSNGNCDPAVQEWIDSCRNYKPPPVHTPDVLMACWFAREELRECGFGSTLQEGEREESSTGIADLLAR